MTDYSELKRLAEAARSDNSGYGDADCYEPKFGLTAIETAFASAATPAAVLSLITENERLSGEYEGCPMAIAEALRIERDQLKVENEALREDHDKAWRLAGMNLENLGAALAENDRLRRQIDDMSPFKGAPLTGPDLKCLACGGYHYGMSGLPCPKMTATASAAMSQGEQE